MQVLQISPVPVLPKKEVPFLGGGRLDTAHLIVVGSKKTPRF